MVKIISGLKGYFMKLIIDNVEYTVKVGQSLYDVVKELGLVKGKLSTDPICAKIAGRVFTLNYVPLREKDVQERSSIRKAMQASNGIVRLLRYNDQEAREAYMRTAQFVIFLAIERLWPHARAKMSCTLGNGVYFKVQGVDDFNVIKLDGEVKKIIKEDILLHRTTVPTEEAIEYYRNEDHEDKAKLLEYRNKKTFNRYEKSYR